MEQFANLDPTLKVNPSSDQAKEYMNADTERPVMYLNLLRYRDVAHYPANYADPALPPNVCGREAFHRYLKEIEATLLPQVGGRFLLVAPIELVVIGAADWDEAMLGFYPSRAAGMRFTSLPGYEAAALHRLAGVAEMVTLILGEEAFARLQLPTA